MRTWRAGNLRAEDQNGKSTHFVWEKVKIPALSLQTTPRQGRGTRSEYLLASCK